MKVQATSYTFIKGAANVGTVTFTGSFIPASLDRILAIVNVTRNVIIYNPVVSGSGGAYTSPTLTLAFDTSTHANTDKLLIYCDDGLLQTVKAVDSDNAVLTNDKVLPGGGVAEDVTAPTAYTIGDVVMFRFDKESGALKVLQGETKAIIDSISISERLKKVSIEITRPADANIYAAEDMIFSSTSTGSLNITGISTGLSDSDSSGYVIAAKLLSNEPNIVGKRLAVLAYDAGSGSYQSQDNAASITGSYTIEKDNLFQIDFDTIVDCIGNPASDDAVICKLDNLRIPYKLNSGTKFNLIFITKDIFTPTSGSKFYIELTLTTNP